MNCTAQQAQRIDSLLGALGIYYVSPPAFESGKIIVDAGRRFEISTFEDAMNVIERLSKLDSGGDPDDMAVDAMEILEGGGATSDDEDEFNGDDW